MLKTNLISNTVTMKQRGDADQQNPQPNQYRSNSSKPTKNNYEKEVEPQNCVKSDPKKRNWYTIYLFIES